jgi:methyl coenzyme M reductase gamma subunit
MGIARANDVVGVKSYVGEGVVVSNGAKIEYDQDGKIINNDALEFAPNTTATYLQDYIGRYYGTDNSTNTSRTFVKLREVVLSYNLPQSLLKKSFINKASISLVGRNLLYFAEKTDIDIEQYTSNSSYSGLQTPTTRRFGFNINLTF